MEIGTRVFRAVSWLAFFNTVSQIFSWAVTIIVARILQPADYGLMEMAIIFTGFAEIFCDMGLGSAIIQRPDPTREELSSVYWFAFGVGLLIAVTFFPISYITAFIFDDDRIISLTQSISVIFIFYGLQTVPLSIMNKELEFKKIGFIEMTAALIASSVMLVLASMGAGVWTLVGGMITRGLTKLILIYTIAKWIPRLHYDFEEVKSYMKFGSMVTLGRSFFYASDISDRFFLGRAMSPAILGYYSFALNLSKLPTEKITVLINQVSYPAFSKLQNDREGFKKFYLKVVKVTAMIVIPLFVGGFLVSEEIINILFGEKWIPMIFIFKFMCITQIMTSLNAVNNFVHNAQGRPKWGLIYHGILAIGMATSFYLAAKNGLNAMLIPWFTTYMVVCGIWVYLTIKKIGITASEYLANIVNPVMATVLMYVAVTGSSILIEMLIYRSESFLYSMISKITVGSLFYLTYLYFYERKLFYSLKSDTIER